MNRWLYLTSWSAAGREDEAGHIIQTCRLQVIEGTNNIGEAIGARIFHRWTDTGIGGKMHNYVYAFNHSMSELFIKNVTHHQFHTVWPFFNSAAIDLAKVTDHGQVLACPSTQIVQNTDMMPSLAFKRTD